MVKQLENWKFCPWLLLCGASPAVFLADLAVELGAGDFTKVPQVTVKAFMPWSEEA